MTILMPGAFNLYGRSVNCILMDIFKMQLLMSKMGNYIFTDRLPNQIKMSFPEVSSLQIVKITQNPTDWQVCAKKGRS